MLGCVRSQVQPAVELDHGGFDFHGSCKWLVPEEVVAYFCAAVADDASGELDGELCPALEHEAPRGQGVAESANLVSGIHEEDVDG